MGKVAGLGLIVLVVALFACAWSAPPRFVRVGLLTGAIALWFVASCLVAGVLAFEHSDVSSSGSLFCPVAGGDSDFVPSHWAWFPPGRVCEYPAGDSGPSYWRVVAIAVLFVTPVTATAVWPRRPGAHAPDPPGPTGRELTSAS